MITRSASVTGIKLTLAEESYIRRGCRCRLKGLAVEVNGQVGAVVASKWSEAGELLIKVEEDGLYIPAELATVVGEWKAKCCRPLKTRLREVLARRARRAKLT